MIRSDTAAKDVFNVQVQRQALVMDTVSTKTRNKNDKRASKQFARVHQRVTVEHIHQVENTWQALGINKLAYVQLTLQMLA